MESLILLSALVLLAGPILALVALVKASALRHRIDGLEAELTRLRHASPAAAPSVTRAPEPEPDPRPDTVTDTVADEPVPASRDAWSMSLPEPAAPTPTPTWPDPSKEPTAPSLEPMTPRAAASTAKTADSIGRFMERIKGWFTTGNVPVKIGMLVLLVGVASLLRYANDQGWLSMPIELRLAGVSAVALMALVFAWRKRHSRRTFALALQGGAIGILLLVVFAAFKRYDLMGAGPAFAISVILIAGLAVLAVLQDSRTLAILGVLAGFMAPLWLSTGGGNHVALFSYYAVLNASILAIAWAKPWRELNLLGFVFTWGIGTAWGVLDYAPDKFASTETFLLLFFAFYLLLPIFYARKTPTPQSARIDGCLLFGTPLIAFALQSGLLQGERMPLALCALGLATLYALLAWWLLGRERLQLLARGYAILAAGFATLAVPLALSARATASVFALEGAGLVWLGYMQQRRLPRWAGSALQLLAAAALLIGVAASGTHDATPIANATCMGALLIALAGFATTWLHRRAESPAAAALAYLWGLAWWLGNGVHEIERFVADPHLLHAVLLLAGVSGWLAAEYARRDPARLLTLTSLGAFLLAFPQAFLQQADLAHPLAGIGAWAWPLFAALFLRSLICLRRIDDLVPNLAQLAWWLAWPTVLSLEAWYIGQRFGLAEGWVGMLLALPWLALAALSLWRWTWLRRPLGAAFDASRPVLLGLVFAALGVWWLDELSSAGDSAPLPWLALVNPLDLAQATLLLLGWAWLRGRANDASGSREARLLLAFAAMALVTMITLRAVHHWGSVPWDSRMLQSQLAQTSLTVVWSLLGVVGWVLGSRRGLWGLWLAGAILMGVVLAKLLLIDRGNLGDLLGIGAFIAYGLLCTLVGWMAPAPPRRSTPTDNQDAGAVA